MCHPRASLAIVKSPMIELINHTNSKEGLVVTAVKDDHVYPTGKKVSDQQLALLHLYRHDFHGDWNYTHSII
ncbi:MAG: hypothetical protein C0410_09695 [Anaerolinea sp.]|nr:hypothetical protein [Anaerolinea sp.]